MTGSGASVFVTGFLLALLAAKYYTCDSEVFLGKRNPLAMKAISFKLPPALYQNLTAEARERGVSKSALIRQALQRLLDEPGSGRPLSALSLAGDLVGSIEGPEDLSVNDEYLNDFGA